MDALDLTRIRYATLQRLINQEPADNVRTILICVFFQSICV